MKTQLTIFGLLLSTLALGQIRPDQSQIKYDITGTTELYTLDNGSIRRVLIQTIDSLNVPGVYEKAVLSDTTSITDEQTGDVMFNSGQDTIAFRGTYGWLVFVGGSGGIWGSITGTLSNQTDLQSALDAKLSAEVDGSITNELDTMTVDGDSGTMNLSDGVTLIVAGGGINTTAVSGNTLTITATEVDGSTTNELIFNQENTSTAATSGTTENYHQGGIGVGDFSGTTLAASVHVHDTTSAILRLSDVATSDTVALASVEFYRGFTTSKLGDVGFTNNTDVDLDIRNNITGGAVAISTDGVEKFRVKASGAIQAQSYGDTLFTGTPVKAILEDDTGNFIEGDPYDLAKAVETPTVAATTNINFNSEATGIYKVDLSGVAATSLSLSNPLNGGQYKFWFENSSSDTLTFPNNFLSKDRDSLKTRLATTNEIMDFFYDGTNYITKDTIWALATTDTVKSVAGLVVWYDVSQETEYSGGASIDTLHDWSGNALHIAQASAWFQPTFQTSVVNGNPIARFDGTNDKMTRTALTELNSGSDFTIFAVAKETPTEATGAVFSTVDSLSGAQRITVWASTEVGAFGATINTDDGGFIYNYLSEQSNTFFQTALTNDFTTGGGTGNLYRNGTLQETLAWTFTTTSYTNDLAILGRQHQTSNFFNGDFAELIIYNSVLSAGDRQLIENYLQNKYGL